MNSSAFFLLTLSLDRCYILFSKIIFSYQQQAYKCSPDFSSGSQTYSQAASNLGLLAWIQELSGRLSWIAAID